MMGLHSSNKPFPSHTHKRFVIHKQLVDLLVNWLAENHIPHASDNSINIEVDREPIVSHITQTIIFLSFNMMTQLST
jgi:hypothetical protein